MEEIKKCLTEFVNSPYDSKINFNLGYAYEKEKQYASAFSYYLRCAEFTEDKVLGSEALLRCSLCLNNQGGRDQKELHFIEHSISTSPNSLEPYLLASRFYSWRSDNTPEKRHWLKSYMYACMGINILENSIQERRFYIDVGYKNYELYYQKALAGTNIGKIDEVREIYMKILSLFEISDTTKSFIKNKLNQLPEQKCSINKIKNTFNSSMFKIDQQLNTINIIPNNIFQTWKTALNDISSEMLYYINSWKKYNPTYNYIFYNDNQCYEFIRDNFDNDVLDAYNRLKPGAFKCDLWRYCVLYICGGFYADIDSLCLSSLDVLKEENVNFICPIDLNPNIN